MNRKDHLLICAATLSFFILAISCFSCKRKVDCWDVNLGLSVDGFDSNEIKNTIIERYTPPGFDHFAGRDPVPVLSFAPEPDSIGYSALLFYTRGEYNYIVRIGNRTVKLEDIYHEKREENQPGIGAGEPCGNIVHYTLDGKSYAEKPHGDSPVLVDVKK